MAYKKVRFANGSDFEHHLNTGLKNDCYLVKISHQSGVCIQKLDTEKSGIQMLSIRIVTLY